MNEIIISETMRLIRVLGEERGVREALDAIHSALGQHCDSTLAGCALE